MKAQDMRFTMSVIRDGVSYDVVVTGTYTPARPGYVTWGGIIPPEPDEFYFESIFFDGPYGAAADLSEAEFEAASDKAADNYSKGIYDDRYDLPDEGLSNVIERIKSTRERDSDRIKREWKIDE